VSIIAFVDTIAAPRLRTIAARPVPPGGSRRRVTRSVPFGLEDGFVTVSVGELDLDRAVFEEFGRSFAVDLVAFLASGPVEADRIARVFDLEAGLQGAEGDFAALRGDRQGRWAAEVEVSAVPEVGFDDPPAADQAAVRRGPHAKASRSFGSRARL
jgi:hypothetical protein